MEVEKERACGVHATRRQTSVKDWRGRKRQREKERGRELVLELFLFSLNSGFSRLLHGSSVLVPHYLSLLVS